MNQYLIIGTDGTDENALDRRMAIRPQHLEKAKELKANGNFILGGAFLNENDQMAGSVMVVEFENDDALQAWLDSEPYINNNVWENYEVRKFKVANF